MSTHQQHARRASVFAVVLWMLIALSAIVLVLCHEMVVELLVARQHLAQSEADAAELGVEQFCLSGVANDAVTPGYLDSLSYEQRQLGDCYFWILRTNPDDEQTPDFGLEAEAGKIDLNDANTAGYSQLMLLPNMTDEIASSIIDWRDPDDNVTGTGGAEDSFYMALNPPYHCKDANFESVEELNLVQGLMPGGADTPTPNPIWNCDTFHTGFITPTEANNSNQGAAFSSYRGMASFFTVYGITATNPYVAPASSTTGTTTTPPAPTAQSQLADVNSVASANLQTVLQQYLGGRAQQIMQQTQAGRPFTNIFDWANRVGLTSQDFSQVYFYVTCNPASAAGGRGGGTVTATTPTPTDKIDIMAASYWTLIAIGFQDQEAQAIITYRDTTNYDPSQKANIAWVLDIVVSRNELRTIGSLITGASTVYSADIVTVTKDGRAFKRVEVVIDGTSIVTDPNTGLITSGAPQIVFRRDLTNLGWPLDPAIRDELRKGIDPQTVSTNYGTSTSNGTNNSP